MFKNLYTYIIDKAAFIQDTYGINPWVFLIMSAVLAFPFYYSIYRVIRTAASKNKKKFVFWGTIFLVLTVIPYIYILFWGRNLPWYIYVIIVFLVLNGVYSLVRKLMKQRSAGKSKSDIE